MIKAIQETMKKKWKLIASVSLGVILAGLLGWYFLSSKSDVSAAAATVTAEKGDIRVTVSGTGTAQPVVTRKVSPKVSGTITKINFKNGQQVKKGDLLFELDNSSVETEIVKADLDLKQAGLDYGSTIDQRGQQQVIAPISGQVALLEVSKGQDVQKNAPLMVIQDTSKLTFSVPFNEAQVKNIQTGQKVDVNIPDLMAQINGTVKKVDRGGVADTDGSKSFYVTVEVTNPGALTQGLNAQAAVHTPGGIERGFAVGQLEWADTAAVRAGIAGTVQQLYVEENQYVRKGQKVAAISSDTINNQVSSQSIKLQQSQLNLNGLRDKLADYKIYAPVDGVVTLSSVQSGQNGSSSGSGNSSSSNSASSSQNYYQVGDEASSGQALATIIGNSGMVVTVPVDEVDISRVKPGQKANITIDALPDRKYQGAVTEVAAEGTVQNGVASFDVTVQIDSPEGIKTNMTANVEIMVAQKDSVLLLPIEAVQERQGRKFVLLPVNGNSSQPRANSDWAGGGSRRSGSGSDSSSSSSSGSGSGSGSGNGSSSGSSRTAGGNGGAAGDRSFRMVPVETGLYNDTMIEITSGLKEGDVVNLPSVARSTSNRSGFGMFGGGRPPGEGGGQRTEGSSSGSGRSGSGSTSGGGGR